MAGTDAGAGTKTLSDAAKAAADVLKQLATALPGADAEKEPESPITNEALAQLRWARKKYDSVVRWILGAFGAIGLVIFGSLPFVELTGVDLWPICIGLGAAALGLGLIIWGASRAFEPEDASLGELDELLERIAKMKETHPGWDRVRWLVSPRWRAAHELRRILERAPETHVGPGMKTVKDLINEIGAAEQQLLTLQAGALVGGIGETLDALEDSANEVGFEPKPPPRDPEQKRGHQLERVEQVRNYESTLRAELLTVIRKHCGTEIAPSEAWEGLPELSDCTPLAEEAEQEFEQRVIKARVLERAQGIAVAVHGLGRGSGTDYSPDFVADLTEGRRLVSALRAKIDGLPDTPDAGDVPVLKASAARAETALPDDAAVARSAALLRAQARLRIRGEARDLLLAESGLTQLRGTFRVVRLLMLIGAFLVFTGGATYAWAVANPSPTGLNTPVEVTLLSKDGAIAALPSTCDVDQKKSFTSAARLVSAENLADPTQGAFRVMLVGEQCPGVFVDVAKDQGAVVLRVGEPGAAEGSDSAADSGSKNEALVVVTIKKGTTAWKTANDVCEVKPKTDLTATAILHSVEEDDGLSDGPFSITLVDGQVCPGATVPLEIGDGEGSYKPTAE